MCIISLKNGIWRSSGKVCSEKSQNHLMPITKIEPGIMTPDFRKCFGLFANIRRSRNYLRI